MTRRKKKNDAKRKRRRRPVIKGKSVQQSSRAAKTLSQADDTLIDAEDPLLDLLLGAEDESPELDAAVPMWMDEQGMHAMLPGTADAETYERLTELYQQNIRNSPMWDEMVREFGLEKAEALLKQCRAEPG